MKEAMMVRAAALLAEQLPRGVFFCVGGKTPNVMTVGWGGLDYFWKRHVFTAPVRPQRHTYGLLQAEGAFTVCIPRPGAMQEAIAGAGTLSGRDGDKFAALGLQTRPAQEVNAPIVAGCALYLECVVRAQADFLPSQMEEAVIAGSYPARDFHRLFYGEIVACYAGEEA